MEQIEKQGPACSSEHNELKLEKINLAVRATKIGLWDMEVVSDDPADPENIFTWSDELRQMLGFTDEDDFPNVLSSWSDRLHSEDKDGAFESLKKHLDDVTGNTPYDIEYRLLKKNGEYGYFRDSGETIRDENGKALRVAGSLMDITKTKNILFDKERQRIEAEAASKAKSDFLSTMSHEIRTPMNAILGITEIMLQNEMLSPDVREAFNKIYISSDMLLGIINDVLDLSKIESGKLELVIDKYEIASLISDTASLNMMRIGSKPIEFKLLIDENTPATVLGDELRVKQILNNLLSNAFKYTNTGTVILSISAEAGSDNYDDKVTLIISVSDTGQGMTRGQLDKLFDEYSRFNRKANRLTEGTGLGMSITKKLVQIMDGEIFVDSKQNKGSTFTVRLPQGKAGSAVLGRDMAENLHQFRTRSRSQMNRVQITREPMPYGRVLIVDDVETNIYVATGLLTPYGLTIDTVDSGFGAIEKIKYGNIYDIVFMDHMMPKMDGIEATKIIREMGYDRPIVALTANAVMGQAEIFLGNGFDDFISKPIDVRKLNIVLNKLIRDKQPPEVIEAARKNAETKGDRAVNLYETEQTADRLAEIFVRDANKSLSAIEAVYEKDTYDENDLRTYIIHTHGMKSALANIGKMELSAFALKLEASARDEDIELIKTETPAFMSSLRALMEKLTPKHESESGGVNEDKPYLQEKLLEVKTACEEFDESAVDEILSGLLKRAWPVPVAKLLDTIEGYLLHSDFGEIAGAVDKYLKASVLAAG